MWWKLKKEIICQEEQNLWLQKLASQRKREDIVVEEKLKNKNLYKVYLILLKVMPMVMAFLFWLNTVLSYFDIDMAVLSFIAGISVITVLYLYISSYVFRFCEYHRMFLHYIVVIYLLNIYDYYEGIPVSDIVLLMIYQIITGIFLFIILYLYVKTNTRYTAKSSRRH